MSKKRNILVTNALPYANGPLHLGHLVGYIQADIWVRLQKMLGNRCLYLCGSDSHGTPIMIQAEKMGITPEALIKDMQASHEADFREFNIDFDNYYTTHSPENRELVETIYTRHLHHGNIVKKNIKQLFDPVKQMFLPDRYIKGECPRCKAKDQYGDNCEACGATYLPTDLINPYSTLSGEKPIEKETEHCFFKLQNYTDFLQAWTRDNHLQPEVCNKLDEWFKAGLREWDITRDAPYFGFDIPGEKNKYFYVWLDAPVGYIASFKHLCNRDTSISFDEYWGKDSTAELYHFIGKDIIYFHALFWPAMLHGADFRTPTAIFANGFLTVNGQKMSKSRGTFIKARTYLNILNPEYLRYYFAAKLNERSEDLDLNLEDFIQRVNSDLVGKFINIASRCAGFITKHFDGKLATTCDDQAMYHAFAKTGDEIAAHFNDMHYSHAIRLIMSLADKANLYIDEQKPWQMAKDPNQHAQVQSVCTMGLNLFRLLMIFLKPVLPQTATQVEDFLQIKPLTWADKETPLLNHTIKPFKPLIQRIDPNQIEALTMAAQDDLTQSTPATAKPATNETSTISIDDFNKIDLRVAKVTAAESVPEADKLLRLTVDIGGESRQIFAGIKKDIEPEQLLGRHVIVVANLAPRKMRFGESQGMMLAASGPEGKGIWLVGPDDGAMPGMRVK